MRLKGNNDFGHMKEAISRRLSPKNVKAWGLPSLFLIDGGKGQLSSAIAARDAAGYIIPMIGLAKREEEVVVHKEKSNVEVVVKKTLHSYRDVVVMDSNDFSMIRLGQTDDITKLLQRVRDESHRFAVSYHSTLKRTRQTTSWLDEVPGIGPTYKRKLLREFGSSRGVIHARSAEIEKLLGPKKSVILMQYVRAHKKHND